ncbi:MerR family transcriptional regulator [Paenibacillus athensensis]|uniref:MerR family transcriptional regulator n=1 Tax=Paenibacillus athensensis TaxID=1967502 RepID=A0A4Y8Q3R3_9BACL|nr:MerR family transcriptional regulator [Paenibacillus athensensis]MCD1258423.1 MerR family transcriptional regulator [Paenibacillus athensensis]
MKSTWKVGEIARLAGLTIRTLRYYDQIGLFSPSGYTDSGHRQYTEADLPRLQQIMSLKELGLSLEEIKSVLTGDRYSLLDIVTMQIGRLRQTIGTQQKLLRELEGVSRQMRRQQPVAAQDFTKLLTTMRQSHEAVIVEKRASWNAHLDRLGGLLDGEPEK